MGTIILGIGDMEVSNDPETSLKTFALGSCVALILHDPATGTGGMVHIALASSNINEEKSRIKPGYFVDTALPALFMKMKARTGCASLEGVKIKLVGGAAVMEDQHIFNIGENNINAVKKILKDQGLRIFSEDTGGDASRTVTLHVATGRTVVSNIKKGIREI
jgi:chemotaxis protein CheD